MHFHTRRRISPSPSCTYDQPAPLLIPPQSLVAASADYKTTGNAFFARADFTSAIQNYDKALASVPTYLDYEVAVLRSNISACHLKLQEWKEAVDSATLALDSLNSLEGCDPTARKPEGKDGASQSAPDPTHQVHEVTDDEADLLVRLDARGLTIAKLHALRTKALLRRAHARSSQGGWSNLAGAQEDYAAVLRPPLSVSLAPLDRRTTEKAVLELSPKIEEAKSREMGEMMGKLKELGNGILKPFGLSTDNFKFEQQEGGGYGMRFEGNS